MNVEFINRQPIGQGIHRSGWPFVMKALRALIEHEEGALIFDDFVDQTFIDRAVQRSPQIEGPVESHNNRIIPERKSSFIKSPVYRRPWVGIFHHCPDIPRWFNWSASLVNLFRLNHFQESLAFCKGAIALTYHVGNWLKTMLDCPVKVLHHPSPLEGFPRWDWETFLKNPDKLFVQTGWFMRNYRFSWQVNAPSQFRKVRLVPKIKPVKQEQADAEVDGLSPTRFRPEYGPPEQWDPVPAGVYDFLLSRNVVGTEMFSASASNGVLDCLVRDCPIIVNRLPGVQEYLGPFYPLYFDRIEDVPGLLDFGRIKDGHQYLRELDKSFLSIERFVGGVKDFIQRV